MNETNGFKGRVRRIEQRAEKRTLGLGHILDFDSYDLEFSPAGKVLERVRYRRDGSKYDCDRFHYDADGRLARSETYDGAGLLTGRSELTYDPAGNETAWKNLSAKDELKSWGTTTYQNKLLIREESYTAEDEPIRKKFFTWEGPRLSHAISEFYGAKGELAERWIENYDAQGRLRETFGHEPDDAPLGDGRYVYEYDDEGLRKRVWSFNDWDQEQDPTSLQVFEYDFDETGNWIEMRKFHQSRSDEHWTRLVVRRKITYFDPFLSITQ